MRAVLASAAVACCFIIASSLYWSRQSASTSLGNSPLQSASPVHGLNKTASEYNVTVGNATAYISPPQPVSATSALCALIVLAVNAMTQQSGADRFTSSYALSPARSSPIVCLADMVVATLWLSRGWRVLGVRGSMYWYRKEMNLLREGQLIPAAAIFFFTIGLLPQVVKVFGASGSFWMKAWAAAFLGSWLVEAAVRFSSGIAHPRTVDRVAMELMSQARFLRKASLMVHQVAIVVQCCIWLWIVIIVSQSENIRKYLGSPVWLFLLGVDEILGLRPPWYLLQGHLDFENFPFYSVSCMFGILAAWGVIVAVSGVTLLWFCGRFSSWIWITCEALAFFPGVALFQITIHFWSGGWTTLLNIIDPISPTPLQSNDEDIADTNRSKFWRFSVQCSEALARKTYRFSYSRTKDQIRRELSVNFAIGNLLSATLYYYIMYHSTGTEKSVRGAWTSLYLCVRMSISALFVFKGYPARDLY